MTVIAYRDGIMAADSDTTMGDIVVAGDSNKIKRLGDGSLYAAAGHLSKILQVYAWLDGKRGKPEPCTEDNFGALRVYRNGKVERVSYEMDVYPSLGDLHVEGAHPDFLLGAMMAGASAVYAVELAIACCRYAGGKVRWVRLCDADA